MINQSVDSLTGLKKMADAFFPYAEKQLGFDQPVDIIFQSDADNAQNILGKTAQYDPDGMSITLFTDKRHPKDVLRSLSHELVHHTQNCRGEFDAIGDMDTGLGYAQKDGHLRRMEEEAYKLGNLVFRDWEDMFKQKALQLQERKLRRSVRKGLKKMLNEAAIRRSGRYADPYRAMFQPRGQRAITHAPGEAGRRTEPMTALRGRVPVETPATVAGADPRRRAPAAARPSRAPVTQISPWQTPPQVGDLTGQKILLVGDSHMAGVMGRNLEKSLRDRGATVVRAAQGGSGAVYWNKFVFGDRTHKRWDPEPYRQKIMQHKYDKVVVSFGGNDGHQVKKSEKGREQFRQSQILPFMRNLQKISPNIEFFGPPQSKKEEAGRKSNLKARKWVNSAYGRTAKELGINYHNMNAMIDNDPEFGSLKKSGLGKDGVHFGRKGGQIYANNVLSRLGATTTAARRPGAPEPQYPKPVPIYTTDAETGEKVVVSYAPSEEAAIAQGVGRRRAGGSTGFAGGTYTDPTSEDWRKGTYGGRGRFITGPNASEELKQYLEDTKDIETMTDFWSHPLIRPVTSGLMDKYKHPSELPKAIAAGFVEAPLAMAAEEAVLGAALTGASKLPSAVKWGLGGAAAAYGASKLLEPGPEEAAEAEALRREYEAELKKAQAPYRNVGPDLDPSPSRDIRTLPWADESLPREERLRRLKGFNWTNPDYVPTPPTPPEPEIDWNSVPFEPGLQEPVPRPVKRKKRRVT